MVIIQERGGYDLEHGGEKWLDFGYIIKPKRFADILAWERVGRRGARESRMAPRFLG